MSGDWPPEWDDPEEELPSGAEQQDATGSTELGDVRLAEVTAYLASVPTPVMPDAVMSRISAALAAEATARAGDGTRAEASSPEGGTSAATGTTANGDRTLGAPAVRARVRRRPGGASGHHGFRAIPVKAVTSVLAGLVVIAGIGYGISRTNGATSSSSSAGSAAGSSSGESSAVAAPAAPEASSSSAAAGGFLGASPQFVVTASGTKYQAATLAAQVRARLATPAAGASGAASSHGPGPSKTSSAAASSPSSVSAARTRAPTSALRGCVLHLTGGQPPRLVDQATYQGTPAYVVASSSHVWVVGLGCTVTNAELITSVALGP